MNMNIQERFGSIETSQQETMIAQEQITEEVNRFQETFEEVLRRIELLEKSDKMQGQLQNIGSRIETLELDQ